MIRHSKWYLLRVNFYFFNLEAHSNVYRACTVLYGLMYDHTFHLFPLFSYISPFFTFLFVWLIFTFTLCYKICKFYKYININCFNHNVSWLLFYRIFHLGCKMSGLKYLISNRSFITPCLSMVQNSNSNEFTPWGALCQELLGGGQGGILPLVEGEWGGGEGGCVETWTWTER